MSVQITDIGRSILIVDGGKEVNVLKPYQVTSDQDYVYINNTRFHFTEITVPTVTSAEDARQQIDEFQQTNVTFSAVETQTATDVSTLIVAANPNRIGLLLTNDGSRDCWLAINDDPVAQEGVLLASGSIFIMDISLVSTQEINAICRNNQSTLLSFQEATV